MCYARMVMCAAGPALRLLVAIVQIAALLAFALPVTAAHARHAPDCAGHAAVHDHAHARFHTHAAATGPAVLAAVDPRPDDAVPVSCCAHSCCHVLAGAPMGLRQPVRWTRPAGMEPAPSAAYAGVTPDTPSEPPRILA